jgi:hypothetical protein
MGFIKSMAGPKTAKWARAARPGIARMPGVEKESTAAGRRRQSDDAAIAGRDHGSDGRKQFIGHATGLVENNQGGTGQAANSVAGAREREDARFILEFDF